MAGEYYGGMAGPSKAAIESSVRGRNGVLDAIRAEGHRDLGVSAARETDGGSGGGGVGGGGGGGSGLFVSRDITTGGTDIGRPLPDAAARSFGEAAGAGRSASGGVGGSAGGGGGSFQTTATGAPASTAFEGGSSTNTSAPEFGGTGEKLGTALSRPGPATSW